MADIRTGPALVIAGLALAGCASHVAGNPSSGNTTVAPSTTTRPAVIKVDTLDPCAAFTPDQLSELRVVKSKRSDGDLVKKGTAPICLYLSNSAMFSYEVGLVTNEGVGYWRSGGGNVDRKETQVAGFAAVRINLSGQSDACSYWVDVADGQMVYVNYLPIGEEPLERVCGNAERAAELALATLQTTR